MFANVLFVLIAMSVPLTPEVPPGDCPHFSICGAPAPAPVGCNTNVKCVCQQPIQSGPNECLGGVKVVGTGINDRLVTSKCCAIGFEDLCFTPFDCKPASTPCQVDSECDSDPPTGPGPVFTMSYHATEGNCNNSDPCGTGEADPD